MNEPPKPCLIAKMSGQRFKTHNIPLDALKDLAAFQGLFQEAAKAIWRRANPNRSRTPKGFAKDFELCLTRIDEGSACAVLTPAHAANGILFNANGVNHEDALASIRGFMEGDASVDFLSTPILRKYSGFTSEMQDDEHWTIYTPTSNSDSDKAVRITREDWQRRLIQRFKVPIVANRRIYARISALNLKDGKFTAHRPDGSVIPGDCDGDMKQSLLAGLADYENCPDRWFLLDAEVEIGAGDRVGKIIRLYAIDDADPMDMEFRLEQIEALGPGWKDGEGETPNRELLHWMRRHFVSEYPDGARAPFIYPTEDGGLRLEWESQAKSVILEISAPNLQATLWRFDCTVAQDEGEESTFDLKGEKALDALFATLRDDIKGGEGAE